MRGYSLRQDNVLSIDQLIKICSRQTSVVEAYHSVPSDWPLSFKPFSLEFGTESSPLFEKDLFILPDNCSGEVQLVP